MDKRPVIKILELFGGIGAPRKALVNLGIDHKSIDYVEIQENRVRAYNALYDHEHKSQSVIGWDLKPDILVHGSPCQDNSRAQYSSNINNSMKKRGAERGSGTRSSLMHETIKIICNMGEWKPKVVIWENVVGVLDKKTIPAFNDYLQSMTELGYSNSFEVLDARDFSVPQARERVFCVSMLDGFFDFGSLEKKPMRHIDDFLEKNVTGPQYMITIPSMLNKIEEFNPVKPDDVYKRRLNVIDSHCWTITERQDRCPNAGVIRSKTDAKYRYLTEREVWRLMGFDDEDFDSVLKRFPSKPGKRNSTLYALAGNSIVVPILEAIFEQLINGVRSDGLIEESNGQLRLTC
ncbi:DNA (cytosine-5-)-methyltransferase [Exiguobacterium sp. SH5S4]|uniref:DNA cytosine methyltransferase n=1 Tax=Exiguobacterium sp. SH5S4 TaxID=2510961 RepID=UPI00103BEE20|nr:DNA cytosine methyltransferase [Exiguobacterium sp. SH5S4]TCI25557.1 DNA (cytosine-5-)-methyltransferase [Exiguobacterium sp. SH5S4]